MMNFLQKSLSIATSLWLIVMHGLFLYHITSNFVIIKNKHVVFDAMHIAFIMTMISSHLTLYGLEMKLKNNKND